MDDSVRATGADWRGLFPVGAMMAGVLAWLWPIGLGGRMPVGGDATQFSIGLMAFLGSALRSGRLPLWNDLWGFGFPGLAESQMGVYYPPHLLLYGLFPTEAAYLASLVLHTLWAAIGANWAARRFGVSRTGAALAGFAWSTSGFFLIHLPHQWGYTVGSWMPWAWGLAWQIARGEGTRRTPWLLAAVLAVQVLPGHFQLAFVTEVGVLVLVLASGRRAIRATATVGLALAAMIGLGAMQLGPTLALARLSGSARGFEYLSGFAASPIHLIGYIAPGLFHRSPLWRPLAWDTFHTSPEEYLPYLGLVPLFLAAGAVHRRWRGDPGTRALAVVAAVTLVLSLGPYTPGFGLLIQLPGFSFFRAPARWSLATGLALSLLAGGGFDLLASWPRAGRSLARYGLVAAAAIGVVVAGFELALAASRGAGWPAVSGGFGLALKALPWSGGPDFREVMARAHRPQDDLRVQTALARRDGKAASAPGPTLAGDRPALYLRDLGETGLILAGLLGAATLARRPRAFASALLFLTAADAMALSRHRPFDLGPARPLVEQSPVLARLAAGPRGLRTLDPAQNLFQVAGAEALGSYRTLDLPAPGPLLSLARGPAEDPRVAGAIRAAGVGLRVLDPLDTRGVGPGALRGWSPEAEVIRDPTLAGWLHGVDLARSLGLADFSLLRPRSAPAAAWLVDGRSPLPDRAMSDPEALLAALRDAVPLACVSEKPERSEIRVSASAGSIVVLSRTYDPEWRATWIGPGDDLRMGEVGRVLGGWQGVRVPEPGRWTLRLEYDGRAARIGLEVSGVAWAVWGLGFWRLGRRSRREAASAGSKTGGSA